MAAASQNAMLVEVLRELTIAWKNRMAYPNGHPAGTEALGRAHRKLADYLETGGPLLLGVAADGWVLEDAKLQGLGVQPVAQALYQRDVAVLGFEPGLEAVELASFLALLVKDPRRGEEPPMADQLAASRVRHVYVESMDFSRITLDAGATVDETDRRRKIWDLILGELIAGRQLSPDGRELDEESRRGLDELSRLLAAALRGGEGLDRGLLAGNESGTFDGDGSGGASAGDGAKGGGGHAAGGAGDRGTGGTGDRSGNRLAGLMAAVFSQARGTTSIATARRLAAVVRAMPEGLRRSLVDAIVKQLASGDEGGDALTVFAAGLPRQTALASLERLADHDVALSARAVRLAHELRGAQRKEPFGAAPVTPESDRLFAELREFYGSADIDRLNPALAIEVGAPLALEMPRPRAAEDGAVVELGERRDTLSDNILTVQLTHALLEIVVRRSSAHVPRPVLRNLRRTFRTLLGDGRLELGCTVVETLQGLRQGEQVSPESKLQLEQTLDRLADERTVAALLDGVHHLGAADVAHVQRLVGLLGPAALRHLLSALGEETGRSRRHLLLRLLSAIGPAIVGEVIPMLADGRWFVVRNAIVLLRTVGDRSVAGEIARCVDHGDARVRLEAIKTLFAFEGALPADLLRRAIADSDPKLAEAVVALAGAHGLAEACEPLRELLSRRDFFGRQRALRLRAIKVLATLRDPSLPAHRRLFRGGLFGAAREERLAAFAALACYPVEIREPLVARGLRARDAELKAICLRLQDAAASAGLEETHV